MPRMKSHELAHFHGIAAARNVGPSRAKKNAGKIEAARADKVMPRKMMGEDRGEAGKTWDETFRKDK